ncbi:MAG TPA: glycosyltransferase family 2 protein [Hydrogenophaga sp.]|nr:glycosyltransferase family 2 protein [Hydrogenophaga sp.]
MIERSVGIVVIGRNEGERLRHCLESLNPDIFPVVYVDSGSTDRSTDLARAMSATVVDLDMSRPFTAARARNEGFARLLQLMPELQFVQFVDGDCEVVDGWMASAADFLHTHPEHAVVCGRRRERYPEHSVYNLLCDEEWNTPVGDAKSCGGDALFRVSAFREVGGYRDGMIAGEEPELCLRLRAAGWRVRRIDHEMTLHDAAMTRFGQWWKRTLRAGHSYAEGASLHGGTPEQHKVKETVRALVWGAGIPLMIFLLAVFLGPTWLWLTAIYLLQWIRFWLRSRSASRASFLLLGKFAEAQGVIKFHLGRFSGHEKRIIEYK